MRSSPLIGLDRGEMEVEMVINSQSGASALSVERLEG